jgi:hypothetical protein
MKGWLRPVLCVLAVVGLNPHVLSAATPAPEIGSFLAAKRAYIERVAKELNAKLPPEVAQSFDAAAQGKWISASNLYENLDTKYGPNVVESAIPRELWQVLQETAGSSEVLGLWDPKYTRQFADEIFKVVPTNAVYFGGTDPGRNIITAFSASHERGQPFFTLTQNPLADPAYLQYIRRIYGNKLKLPTDDDSTQAFQDYLADAQRRLEHDRKFPNEPKQLKRGEGVKIIDDRVQITGEVAVMAINARLVRKIFDLNPDREFYLEESLPLDWTYPHLIPAGPIFKISRTKIESLSAEVIAKDRVYWDARMKTTLGRPVTDENSLADVCAFVDKIYRERKLDDFKGDRTYLTQESVQKSTTKLRGSIAGLYAWRAKEAGSAAERRRMVKEAELAFMQAYSLGPANSEVATRFMSFLMENSRKEDALRFIRAAAKLNPNDKHTADLLSDVEAWYKNKTGD